MKRAVAIIAIQGNQILLVRNAKRSDSVEIPGGACRDHEGCYDTAWRELFEETNLYAEPEDFSPFHTKRYEEWCVELFTVRKWRGELKPGDDVSACWFGDPHCLLEGSHPEDYETVVRALKGTR